jgi:DNA sulfur modification protein DndD
MLLDGQLSRALSGVRKRQHEMDCLNEEIGQYDNYLSVDIDEKEIARIYKQIKEIEQEIIDTDVLLTHAVEERRTANGKALVAEREFNHRVEAYLKSLELSDDNERIVKYTNVARNVVAEYRIRLQARKIDNVARTMTNCYKRLASKTSLIDHIEMDPVSLDLRYVDSSNNEINKTSLSAGEQQLMVISLLWALALCSKRKLPVIIDTPLSRLDSHHRVSLIENYFPNASEQTIILSTDSEIDRYYYEMMKDNIGDEFLLDYDDARKATTIRRGYFRGEQQ